MKASKLSLDNLEVVTFATTPALGAEMLATGLLNSCNSNCVSRVDSTCPCC